MKKRLSVFCYSLILAANVAFSQTNKAIYSYQMSENVPELMLPIRDEVNSSAENNYLLLYFDKTYSFYTSENIENDKYDQSDIFAKTYNPYWYSSKEQKYYYEFTLDKEYTAEDAFLYEWEITKESKEISGYICFKAYGKTRNLYADEENGEKPYHTVETWFAPSLPYSYGPKKYAGLPGLVVYAVENGRDMFKLEKIEFDIKHDLSKLPFNSEKKEITSLIKSYKELSQN